NGFLLHFFVLPCSKPKCRNVCSGVELKPGAGDGGLCHIEIIWISNYFTKCQYHKLGFGGGYARIICAMKSNPATAIRYKRKLATLTDNVRPSGKKVVQSGETGTYSYQEHPHGLAAARPWEAMMSWDSQLGASCGRIDRNSQA